MRRCNGGSPDGSQKRLFLGDGPSLEYRVWGEIAGWKATIVYLHGFPAEDEPGAFEHEAAIAAGVRIIAPARPGYNSSSLLQNSTLFGQDADSPDFFCNLAYLYDLVWLTYLLQVEESGIIGFSGGGAYATTAAYGFQDALAKYVSSTDPPKVLPKLTAVGVVSGGIPWHIHDHIASSNEAQADLYALQRAYRRATEDESYKIPEEISAKTGHTDWGAKGVLIETELRTGLGDGGWGFKLPLAGAFLAADGKGIRYWYGDQDLRTPCLSGRALAKEVGGSYLFATQNDKGGLFMGHGFDFLSKLSVYNDFLESMDIEHRATDKELALVDWLASFDPSWDLDADWADLALLEWMEDLCGRSEDDISYQEIELVEWLNDEEELMMSDELAADWVRDLQGLEPFWHAPDVEEWRIAQDEMAIFTAWASYLSRSHDVGL